MASQKLNSDFSSNDLEVSKKILDTLPNSIYLKDLQGRYIWLNSMSIKKLKYKHLISSSIIGKTDFDVFPAVNAAGYAQNDRIVIETKQGICKEEDVILPTGQKLTQLSFKEPLYNNHSSIIGILGYTIDIAAVKELRREIIARFTGNSHVIPGVAKISEENGNYCLGIQPDQEIILTNREYTVLKYLLLGMSAKQIAVKLHLSNRTIEGYFQQLKTKFQCNNKYRLIEVCMQLGITRQII